MLCLVRQADSVILEVEVDSKAKGKQCLDKVCGVLGIIESDYMGLQYTGPHGEKLWLNLRNQLRKQLPGPPPYRLELRVKFFVPPHLILQEVTRHHFYLDVRRAFVENTLRTTSHYQMCHLAALIAQVELGDLEVAVDTAIALMSYSKFLPSNCATNCSDDHDHPPQLRVRWRSGGSSDNNSNDDSFDGKEEESQQQKKMPAKKVGRKQFKSYAILVGMSVSDMTKDQLESHVYQLQQEIEKEKEERNFFQIERDKIQLFWEVTKTQLEEKDAVLQLKDSEIDEAELSHLAEIKLYKQKMKQVMFECQQHINEQMKEKMGEKLIIEEEHQMKVNHLESEINKLKDEIFQLKIDHENTIMEQRLKQGEELCGLHEKYQKEIDLIKSEEVEEIGNIRNQLDILQKKAIKEVETLKDAHTQHLIRTHEELVQKMKNYYNNIIKNNVLLIHSMKNTCTHASYHLHADGLVLHKVYG